MANNPITGIYQTQEEFSFLAAIRKIQDEFGVTIAIQRGPMNPEFSITIYAHKPFMSQYKIRMSNLLPFEDTIVLLRKCMPQIKRELEARNMTFLIERMQL